jgi:hypothetical protein
LKTSEKDFSYWESESVIRESGSIKEKIRRKFKLR